jgi:hypothetical protein
MLYNYQHFHHQPCMYQWDKLRIARQAGPRKFLMHIHMNRRLRLQVHNSTGDYHSCCTREILQTTCIFP